MRFPREDKSIGIKRESVITVVQLQSLIIEAITDTRGAVKLVPGINGEFQSIISFPRSIFISRGRASDSSNESGEVLVNAETELLTKRGAINQWPVREQRSPRD